MTNGSVPDRIVLRALPSFHVKVGVRACGTGSAAPKASRRKHHGNCPRATALSNSQWGGGSARRECATATTPENGRPCSQYIHGRHFALAPSILGRTDDAQQHRADARFLRGNGRRLPSLLFLNETKEKPTPGRLQIVDMNLSLSVLVQLAWHATVALMAESAIAFLAYSSVFGHDETPAVALYMTVRLQTSSPVRNITAGTALLITDLRVCRQPGRLCSTSTSPSRSSCTTSTASRSRSGTRGKRCWSVSTHSPPR